MVEDLGYGKRLSDAEYDRRIVELQSQLPPMPSHKLEHQTRRKALDLAINHRLGMDFPHERRQALWAIMQRIEKKRIRMGIQYGIRSLLGLSAVPNGLSKQAQGIAGFMFDAFSKVLNEKELRSFFDLKEDEHPSLPFPHQHK